MSSDIYQLINKLSSNDKYERNTSLEGLLNYIQTYLENEKVAIYVYVVVHHYVGQSSDLDRVFYDKEDAISFVKRKYLTLTCIENDENKISFSDNNLPHSEWITINKEKILF
ncbi:MAG: hypothetical protein ACPKQO_10085 [Nitrososphaeraceae archaeon]